jgi:hypothetical protein
LSPQELEDDAAAEAFVEARTWKALRSVRGTEFFWHRYRDQGFVQMPSAAQLAEDSDRSVRLQKAVRLYDAGMHGKAQTLSLGLNEAKTRLEASFWQTVGERRLEHKRAKFQSLTAARFV